MNGRIPPMNLGIDFNFKPVLQAPKACTQGLGMSPNSGPATGGTYSVNLKNHMSTFFGADIKSLLPLEEPKF